MRHFAISSILFALVASSAAFGADAEAAKAKPYTLDTCPISGEKLGDMGDSVVKTYQGQEVKFCCSGCVKKFEKDIDGNLKKVHADIDKAAAGEKAKPADAHHVPVK